MSVRSPCRFFAAKEKYRIVYADPPWDYGAHAQPDYQTEQRDHYAHSERAPIFFARARAFARDILQVHS
jgi:hypothetical protein